MLDDFLQAGDVVYIHKSPTHPDYVSMADRMYDRLGVVFYNSIHYTRFVTVHIGIDVTEERGGVIETANYFLSELTKIGEL